MNAMGATKPHWKSAHGTQKEAAMIKESIAWPSNVSGFDWTQPPMERPPEERTQIGYFNWHTQFKGNLEKCERQYFVMPDGSAEILHTMPHYNKNNTWVFGTWTEVLAPGTWACIYPTTTLPSYGGCWIESLLDAQQVGCTERDPQPPLREGRRTCAPLAPSVVSVMKPVAGTMGVRQN
jgi:hypothetical protein